MSPANPFDPIAHILDASAHASRKAEAALLHAAQQDGAYTGGKPDNDQSILAYAATAAGMEYRPEVSPDTASLADVTFKIPAKIKEGERRPYPETCLWDEAVANAPRDSASAIEAEAAGAAPSRRAGQAQDSSRVNRPSYHPLSDSRRRTAEQRAVREAS